MPKPEEIAVIVSTNDFAVALPELVPSVSHWQDANGDDPADGKADMNDKGMGKGDDESVSEDSEGWNE
ncbi:hypothetical protein BJY52DRAFT_1187954 [Lactarius psammicola]|nr:hypothetical protein BJY52DRAFT_1187954 [Lactarius psammicola]